MKSLEEQIEEKRKQWTSWLNKRVEGCESPPILDDYKQYAIRQYCGDVLEIAKEYFQFKMKEEKQEQIDFNIAAKEAKEEGLELGMELSVELMKAWNDKVRWTKTYLVDGRYNTHIQNFKINREYEDTHEENYFVYNCSAFPIKGFKEFKEEFDKKKKIMSMKNHSNFNLLFFLNTIIGSVLDSLVGEFRQRAKQKFNILIKESSLLEREVLKACDDIEQDTYNKSSLLVAGLLNEFIDAYNSGISVEFLEYVKKFKDK